MKIVDSTSPHFLCRQHILSLQYSGSPYSCKPTTMKVLLPLLLVSSALRSSAFTSKTRAIAFSRFARSMTSTEQAVDVATDSIVIPAGPKLPPIPATSKRLFLVRHGEVINPGGNRPVYYGAMDVPLSPLGEQEAKAAAQYLQQFSLEHVSSSPLSRAMFGAYTVLELQGKDSNLMVLDGFTELDRGAWCGLTKEEIGANNMKRFDACDESVTPEGGESFPALKKRVLEARDTLLEKTSMGHASALVSHLQVTRCILSEALDIPTNKMVTLPVATASVTCIDYDMESGTQTVHYQSFKPEVGLAKAKDGAN